MLCDSVAQGFMWAARRAICSVVMGLRMARLKRLKQMAPLGQLENTALWDDKG